MRTETPPLGVHLPHTPAPDAGRSQAAIHFVLRALTVVGLALATGAAGFGGGALHSHLGGGVPPEPTPTVGSGAGPVRPDAARVRTTAAHPAGPRDEAAAFTLYVPEGPPPNRRPLADWEAADLAIVPYLPDYLDPTRILVEELLQAGGAVSIVVPTQFPRDVAVRWLQEFRNPRVTVLKDQVDTPWVRDYGPLQVRDEAGRVRWVRPLYHADRPDDTAFAGRLAAAHGAAVEDEPMYQLDGGALVTDGEGLCVVSRLNLQWALLLNRTEGQARRERLMQSLGCRLLVSVPPLPRDSTAHVDMFLQFLAPGVAALAVPVDPRDTAAARAVEGARKGLLAAYAHLGKPAPTIVDVPLPGELEAATTGPGHRKYHTYVNGLRLPDRFLVPHYAAVPRAIEAEAYRALSSALPEGVGLIPVPADAILAHGGSVHCVTLTVALPGR